MPGGMNGATFGGTATGRIALNAWEEAGAFSSGTFMTTGILEQDIPDFAPITFGRATVKEKPKKEQSEEEVFVEVVRQKLAEGEPIDRGDMKRYLKIVRRDRHVNREERRYAHDPVKNPKKTTSSCPVDDLVPA